MPKKPHLKQVEMFPMKERKRVIQRPGKEPLRAKQEFRQEADINHIVSRHLENRNTPPFSTAAPETGRKPVYMDISSVNYQEMRNQIADLSQVFMSLPPKVRKYYQNDPYHLLRKLEDPEHAEQAREFGLIPKQPVQPPAGAGEQSPQGSTPKGGGPVGGATGTASPGGGQGGNVPQ